MHHCYWPRRQQLNFFANLVRQISARYAIASQHDHHKPCWCRIAVHNVFKQEWVVVHGKSSYGLVEKRHEQERGTVCHPSILTDAVRIKKYHRLMVLALAILTSNLAQLPRLLADSNANEYSYTFGMILFGIAVGYGSLLMVRHHLLWTREPCTSTSGFI